MNVNQINKSFFCLKSMFVRSLFKWQLTLALIFCYATTYNIFKCDLSVEILESLCIYTLVDVLPYMAQIKCLTICVFIIYQTDH